MRRPEASSRSSREVAVVMWGEAEPKRGCREGASEMKLWCDVG